MNARRGLGALLAMGLATGPAAAVELVIAGGERNGVYMAMIEDLSRLASENGLPVSGRESAGSLTNAYAVRYTPGVQLGVVQSDVLDFLASHIGDPALSADQSDKLSDLMASLRVVAPMHLEEMHVLARSDIRDLAGLEGKRVSVGANGGGSYVTAERVFNLAGVDVEPVANMSAEDSVEALRAGLIDAMVFVVGQPASAFALGVSPQDDFHFLAIDDPAILALYDDAVIETASYPWMELPTRTLGVRALLVGYPYRGVETCEAIGSLATLINAEIETLRARGHPEWAGVEPALTVARWERNACAPPPGLAATSAAAQPEAVADPAEAVVPAPADSGGGDGSGGLLDQFKR